MPTTTFTVQSVHTQYGHSWMQAALLSWQSSQHAVASPHEELRSYLTSPVEEVANVVGWWDVHRIFT